MKRFYSEDDEIMPSFRVSVICLLIMMIAILTGIMKIDVSATGNLNNSHTSYSTEYNTGTNGHFQKG